MRKIEVLLSGCDVESISHSFFVVRNGRWLSPQQIGEQRRKNRDKNSSKIAKGNKNLSGLFQAFIYHLRSIDIVIISILLAIFNDVYIVMIIEYLSLSALNLHLSQHKT